MKRPSDKRVGNAATTVSEKIAVREARIERAKLRIDELKLKAVLTAKEKADIHRCNSDIRLTLKALKLLQRQLEFENGK